MDQRLTNVTIVGAGAVGAALARRLVAVGGTVAAVLSRTKARARRLAEQVDAPVASSELADLPPSSRLVVCCVPDGAIGAVASELSDVLHDWDACVAAHTSGALTARVLAPLAEQGAAPLSFHPMQTFTSESPPAVFQDIVVGLEGADEAIAVGKRLALLLGSRPLVLSAEAKGRYHLAASMTSNFLVTVVAAANELLSSAGIPDEEHMAVLRPLVEQTWKNLLREGPADALTGPILRGDDGTVEQHVKVLEGDLPRLVPLYTALAVETVRLAAQSGRLGGESARRVLDVVWDAVAPPTSKRG